MSCYDAGYTSGANFDVLNTQIAQEKQRIAEKEEYVKVDLKTECTNAEQNQEEAYQNNKYLTGIFNVANNETTSYNQELQKLQEEMQLAINKAKEQAEKEGKTQQEIDNICFEIQSEYGDRIKSLQYNITVSSKNTSLKQTSMQDALSTYRESRFNNIFASNNYLSGLFGLARDYEDLGKMQQFSAFLEAQDRGGGFDRLG